MAIGPISAAITSAASNTTPLASAVKAAGPEESSANFGNLIAKALDSVQGAQSKSDSLATKAATGDLNDIHDYMIASTEASMATELTVAVRNKAVEAFNDIMRMQI
jgi:flagellar hook-basal body complex protein FliE